MREGDLEQANLRLQKGYEKIRQAQARFEGRYLANAEIILVAYGSMARIAKGAISKLREAGKKVGLIRPISLWPFPEKPFHRKGGKLKYLVLEMSSGQLLEDVRLAVSGKHPVEFLGRSGGGVPSEEQIIDRVKKIL